jgi:adenine-specific DNA-methyltransferase
MTGESLNIIQDQLKKLKQLFPEAITEGKVDWEKLKASLGKENIEFQNERYVLNWAGKSEAFKILQQPTMATLKPVPEESVNFDTTENIFIEGENLEVLKVLQKSYYGKIKVIEIDPPYNTGNDSFIYPDSFKESREEYQKRIGEKDEEGYLMKEGFFRKNSKDNGHYHSNWLSMMYPRLFLARNLLRDDGVIFVHIDDNEVHNLRMVMNEIFGEENFVAEFVWKRRASSALAEKLVSTDHEYVVCYHKLGLKSFSGLQKDYAAFKNPDNDPRGEWTLGDLTVGMTKDQRPNQFYDLIDPKTSKVYNANPDRVWAYIKESMDKIILDNKVFFPSDTTKRPMFKRFKADLKSEVNPLSSLLDEVGMNSEATREIRDIFDATIFSYSKPLSLIKKLVSQTTNNNDIILDFFGGSGTTAQAIIELNKEDKGKRTFIMVQLPELCEENSEAYKTGFKTIADIGKERIRRVIKKIERERAEKPDLFDDRKLDLGFKVFKLSSSNFKIWRGNEITEENLETQLQFFIDPVKENQSADESSNSNMLYELMLKAGYMLVDKVERKGKYYSVNGGELIIALEEMNQELIDTIISNKPKKVITLDKLFAANDQLKTNTVLQMRDVEIDFKTI